MYADKKLPNYVQFIENPIPTENLDKIYCKSSEIMNEIPDYSVHLMVTSPPYNVKKEYDEDLSLEEYRTLLKTVFKETYEKLVTGGRACINVANLGRKPYLPLHSYIIEDMLDIGFFMRGEIINTITGENFIEWTKSVWTFPAVSARSIGHPAPFPEELPHRLIQLYTFKDDLVLDPFCGSGTACLAAIKDGRHYIGYDIEEKYVQLANQRIKHYTGQKTLFENNQISMSIASNEKLAHEVVNRIEI